jgi:hypothetical protein
MYALDAAYVGERFIFTRARVRAWWLTKGCRDQHFGGGVRQTCGDTMCVNPDHLVSVDTETGLDVPETTGYIQPSLATTGADR